MPGFTARAFFVPLWVLVEIFRFSLIVRSPVMGKAQTLAG
jgi:hypothetical protein